MYADTQSSHLETVVAPPDPRTVSVSRYGLHHPCVPSAPPYVPSAQPVLPTNDGKYKISPPCLFLRQLMFWPSNPALKRSNLTV